MREDWNKIPKVLDAPCKGCVSRYSLCHSKCGKYRDYRIALDAYNKEERKKMDTDYVTVEFRKRISRFDRTKRGSIS